MLPVAAAIAARTKRVRIPLGVLLLPFHNPIRLAENIAVFDVISGGRFELGVGMGYKVEEFEGFVVPFDQRGARTNEARGIIRRLLEGRNRHCEEQILRTEQRQAHTPANPATASSNLGRGFTLPALRRAARYGDGFTMPSANCEVYDKYVSELERLGKATEGVRFAGGFQWLIVSNDPEKTWSEAADYIIYQAGQLPAVGRKGRPVAQPSKPARPRAPTSEWPPQGRRT
jgi:alkanesulfonate monooxygenase SsuD/methylene tetrahydromethanopterin reductase-like flavin-dependent oxidoreductase (luciferase family)